MPVKLPPQLSLFNSCPAAAATLFRPMKSIPPVPSSRAMPAFSRMFPFRLKYLALRSRDQIGLRRLSTRPFQPRAGSSSEFRKGGDRGEVRAAKSLIEDEAELSDWVSELRTLRSGSSSSPPRRFSSDDEGSDEGRGRGSRGRSRNADGGRGAPPMKRRRDSDSDDPRTRNQGGNANPSLGRRNERDSGFGRGGNGNSSMGRRNGRESELGYGKDRGASKGPREGRTGFGGNVNSSMGRRNGREFDSGFRRDRDAVEDLRKGGYGSQKVQFSDDDDDDDIDEEDIERVRGSIGNLLNEEDSDIDDDDDNNVDDLIKPQAAPSSPGNDSYLSETRFDQCSVSPMSLKGIKDAGYEKMTMVQEASLPVILKGKDVLAKAKTGTGKTVAFLLPSIEVVVKSPPSGRDQKRPPILVLVICPTRELASQAAAEAGKLLKYHPSIGVQVVIGGTRLALEQKRMQANPCQILVATPGRLRDHIENTPGFGTRLMGVKVLVLDEADHLLDMGFRKDIERIIAAVPKQRQTLLFSATIPDEVRQICHIALRRDHEFINTVQEGSGETHAQVRQMHLIAPLDKHFSILYALLKEHIADDVDYKVLVFCTTAMVTRLVADLLGELKLNVREIHSRKAQSYRTKVSDEFRKSKGLILVTSDVSARGVDYPDVTLVIQVGLPSDKEQYIHRLGRTGRKGKEGQGILLLAPWEEFFLSTVKDLPITKAQEPLVDPDTKKMVERALSHVEMKNKESAYQAWLGYYNSNKKVGKDKVRLVQLANEFSRSMGLDNPPAIKKVVVGKMGLKNVPGLRTM